MNCRCCDTPMEKEEEFYPDKTIKKYFYQCPSCGWWVHLKKNNKSYSYYGTYVPQKKLTFQPNYSELRI